MQSQGIPLIESHTTNFANVTLNPQMHRIYVAFQIIVSGEGFATIPALIVVRIDVQQQMLVQQLGSKVNFVTILTAICFGLQIQALRFLRMTTHHVSAVTPSRPINLLAHVTPMNWAISIAFWPHFFRFECLSVHRLTVVQREIRMILLHVFQEELFHFIHALAGTQVEDILVIVVGRFSSSICFTFVIA